MRFRLTPRSMFLDDLELLYVRIISEFCGISQIWEVTTAERMKIGPYCQLRNCSPLNVLFSDVSISLLYIVECSCARVYNQNRVGENGGFYPRDAILARVIVIATCLSVCHAPVLCQSEES